MINNSKKRRIKQKYFNFISACSVSLLGLLSYVLFSRYIYFPVQWFSRVNEPSQEKLFLFFSGIDIHLQVNFFLGILFSLLNSEKKDWVKIKKWRFWINKVLILISSLILGLYHYWQKIKNSLGNILLLCLIIIVINCCLLEIIIQLMNQYGICNFLNLVLFTEFTPFGWLQKNWSRIWIVWLYLITIFFIWITNLKLEMPVEINTLYNQNNKLLKNSEFKLGFRLNFSLIPLIYLSTFIRHVYTFFLMRGRTDWTSLGSIFSNLEKANKDKIILNEKHRRGKKGFWYCFFSLNEDKWIFNWKNLEKLLSRNKWMIVGAIIFLVLFRWLVIWFQARKISPWKTKEISKDLQKRGIYINYISPGNSTRQLLKKIVNKIIIFWNFSILILNIIFDNIFAYAGKNAEKLNFMSWFGGVNIGVELIRQIRTKFEYIKNS